MTQPAVTIRLATAGDLSGIWQVRYSVTENTLVPGRISDEEVCRSLEDDGCGWVAEEHDRILGFAIGLRSGNLWALFVRPDAEGRGIGSRLHEALLAWYVDQPLPVLWLSTDADSRARRFYEARGWQFVGPHGNNEVRLEYRNG